MEGILANLKGIKIRGVYRNTDAMCLQQLGCEISGGNFKQVYTKNQGIFCAFYIDVVICQVVLCSYLTSLKDIIYFLVSSFSFQVMILCLCTRYTKNSLCITNSVFSTDAILTFKQLELCCFVTLTKNFILRELAFLQQFS